MASARTLTTNELGTVRYNRAVAHAKWPIEVRLLPQSNDPPLTRYTLHTPSNAAVPFSPTRGHELRATLAVPAGALIYEVLRDGVLISTGGLDVRAPLPPLYPAPSTSSASDPSTLPSGAAQQRPPYANPQPLPEHGRVVFAYRELLWTAREVSVLCASTWKELARLRRNDAGFEGAVDVPVGNLAYRFRVVPFEAGHARLAPPTSLGWDEGASSNAWEQVTWPLALRVSDLKEKGEEPGVGWVVDGLRTDAKEMEAAVAARTHVVMTQMDNLSGMDTDLYDDEEDNDTERDDMEDVVAGSKGPLDDDKVSKAPLNRVEETREMYDDGSDDAGDAGTGRDRGSNEARRKSRGLSARSGTESSRHGGKKRGEGADKGQKQGGRVQGVLGFMVTGAVMFALGCATAMMMERWRFGEDGWEGDGWTRSGGGSGDSDSKSVMSHQRGVSF